MSSTATAYQSGFDVNILREQFPVLKQEVKGRPLVYFDNAATTQKPISVINAITDYYSSYNANIHRGIHSLAERATAAFEESRDSVKQFINAAEREEIVFTSGATESINLVAQTWGRANIQEGDEIIVSAMEHHSNFVPWYMLAREKKAVLKVLPITNDGELHYDELQDLISIKTKLVAIVHVSNALGVINPVEKIIEKAQAVGAVVLVDGAQSAVHLDIDVQAMNCDFFVFSAHKVYGPTGVGALYGKRILLEKMPPYKGGGEMIKEVDIANVTYNDLPYKFEAGTPNIAGVIAFGAALRFVDGIGKNAVRAHEAQLLHYAEKALKNMEGVSIIGQSAHKISVVSFVVENVHPQDIGILLDNKGVAVRTGHHCAQPLMKCFNIPGTTRASFALYNTFEEVDIFIEALKKSIQLLR